MATGKRAFQKKSGVETLSAIIREEPEEIGKLNPDVPAAFRWIVERCLAKDPDERYASTKDLARDFAGFRDRLPEALGAAAAPKIRRLWPVAVAALVAAALVSGTLAYLAGQKTGDLPPPSFHQLTFRRGSIYSARFAADGETIVYTGAWDGKPMEIFVGRIQSADARPFGLAGAEVLAISGSGEMAVSLNRILGPNTAPNRRVGTLARLSIGGGTSPREIFQEVEWADWAPDGKSLALVREGRLEYPPGKVLHETTEDGWISHPRVSPDGDSVAFIEHPVVGGDAGSVMIVNRSGARTKLAGNFLSAQGLSWSPNGEVWFAAAPAGSSAENRSLYSVTRGGKVRTLARIAGTMTLQDISRQGRLLVTRDTNRIEIGALAPGESRERELTWLDWSNRGRISPDGKLVLFTGPSGDLGSQGSGGGDSSYFVYLRKTDGSPPVRLGEGTAACLSPDGRWALAALQPETEWQLVVYPTGAGEPRRLPPPDGFSGMSMSQNCFLPDGKQFVFGAEEKGRDARLYVRDIDGGPPRAITPAGFNRGGLVSPDGKWVYVEGPDLKPYLYPIAGGEPREITGLDPGERVVQFGADGRSLYLSGPKEVPRKVYRFDLATGRKELWRAVMPGDAAGVSELYVFPTPNGESYLYTYTRSLSDLYLVEGLR